MAIHVDTSYGDVKIRKRDLREHSRDAISRGGPTGETVAVIVAGNGMTWEPDAHIWLDTDVAYELQEANIITLIGEGDELDGCWVFTYEA